MPSRSSTEAGLVDARAADARPSDRVVVLGGGPDTLALLRLATVRSDEVVLVAERIDAATSRYAESFAVEMRERAAAEADLAGASAAVLAIGDRSRENALVRAARRRGVPVHVAGRPLVSDFTMLELVERAPASVAVGR